MKHRPIYWDYFKLDAAAYRDKVKLYEENVDQIATLIFEDKFEIDIDYLFCLFEIGRYERFLNKVDGFIELVIIENIIECRGVDIYKELLFRKAACLYQLHQFEMAGNILKQLINIDKSNPYYLGLYGICLRKIHKDIYLSMKAMVIASFIVILGITVARILLEPLFQYYFAPFILLRTGLLIGAILLLIGMEAYFQYRIYKDTGMFSFQIINRIFGI